MNHLKRLLNAISRPFSRLSSFRDLQSIAGNGLVCPVYHICRDSTPPWWGQRYPIKSPQEFEKDLDFLASLGPFVSLSDLLEWKNGNRDRPQGCFLSFDDGYRELAEIIAPILLRKGIPATFFLVSSILDNTAIFHEDLAGLIQVRLASAVKVERQAIARTASRYNKTLEQTLFVRTPDWALLREICGQLELDCKAWLAGEKPYLTTQHVKKLIGDGFAIGSHSVDHPLFMDIDDQQKLEQIRSSTAAISSQFSLNYRAFAFPYGEFGIDYSFLELLQNSKYLDLCFGTRGITMDEFEPFLIQRVLAEGHQGPLRNHLHREMRLQKHRVTIQRATVKRPRLVA